VSRDEYQEFADALAGTYDIERELGRGGMATVYLARDVRLDRQVAIKVLHPDLAAAVGLERFKREIDIVSTLSHPHILSLYDSGEAAGKIYYVMPFMSGESLADRLKRERQLPIEEAVRLAMQVASALHYAHKHNVLHRDIKPDNILIEDGVAVVADFGIARAASAAGDAPALTQTGMALGTPTYMSPEQALADKNVDGRSDQYALACVLYEMLAGQPPFTGGSLQVLLMRHTMEAVPSLRIQRQTVSEDLESVIFRALSKSPADRFATMAEFAEALQSPAGFTQSWRVATGATPAVGAARGSSRGLIAAVAVGAIALAGAAGYFMTKPGGAAANDIPATPVAILYFEDLTADSGLVHIADGLTESLIERLSRIDELKLVSQSGVVAYRGSTMPRDSIAKLLKANTLVTGSIDRDGGRLRLNVRLFDWSGVELDKQSFVQADGNLVALTDTLTVRVADFLRERIGDKVRLGELRQETLDGNALLLVQQGQRLVKDGDAAAEADQEDAALAALVRADSLLSEAERRDPRWARPLAQRSWVAYRRARLSPLGPEAARWAQESIQLADRALAIEPRNSAALEYRGTARYFLWLAQLVHDPRQAAELLAQAEADLAAAAEADSRNASALRMLSHLYTNKPDFPAANLAALEAYRRDPFLARAADVLDRLYITSYTTESFDKARQWCEEGRARFPDDARFTSCALWLLTVPRVAPTALPDSAWRLAQAVEKMTAARALPFTRAQGGVVVAMVLGRAGLADSARAVLLRSRVGQDVDPTGELLYIEAFARITLGEKDEAVRLLTQYLTRNPDHRDGLKKDATWWWRELEGHPGYRRLLGVGG
jgi:eukaryotic-like serine/threonine-protein kinase